MVENWLVIVVSSLIVDRAKWLVVVTAMMVNSASFSFTPGRTWCSTQADDQPGPEIAGTYFV